MANYNTLISAIQSVIAANGNNEITGPILQQTLLSIVASLGTGYQFIGIATPETTPGTPDQRVFYIGASGTYPNFGPAVIPDGNLAVFYYDSSWHYGSIEFPVGNGSITTQKIADNAVTQQKLASELLQYLLDYSGVTVGQSRDDSADFEISDGQNHILVRFKEGHIETKYFNSADIKIDVMVENNNDADLDIEDENDNVLVRFKGGHIETKYFNSADMDKSHWYGKSWMGFGTSITNTANEGKYPTYLAQLSGLTFSNHGHSGGGITTASNQAIYNDVMSTNLAGVDLITLEIGANDEGAALGTIYDGLPGSPVTDNSTFCGALNICIRHLQANSNAQIVIIASPHQRYKYNDSSTKYDGNEKKGTDQHTDFDRDNAIEQVCKLNSCWFIPGGAMDGMGFARMNASNDYNTDQIHQTNLGGYNFAQAIWAFLKNIPLFYTSIQ